MPKDKQIKKVLVIGSGPIVIGQAAEFDYAGTQACLTLKEEGCAVILINNNPATIMTDENVADKVYFEPLTVQNIEKIIKKEQPDGILATVSGQTGLNLAFDLQEQQIIEKYNLTVLGTPIDSIMQGEDRNKFRNLMKKIEEPIPESAIVDKLEDALIFSKEVGFPIIVRPAYTLGGSGGGIATDENDFIKFVTRGLRASPISQCLIEKSIAGWKEIEFEVIRDKANTAVVVCHMENIDPVGVHTGDSIVVAPVQTLSPNELEMLRKASLKIVKELGIIGACNVQLAFEPQTKEYIIIEVNPRVSRSSALASKATGYPIAKIATKLSLGYTLSEINYDKANETLATFEPTLDYVVVKFPCWPFEKLTTADRSLGTQMKATGEVMAIEKTVAAGLQKAVRSLELEVDGLSLIYLQTMDTTQLKKLVDHTDDRRFFALLELMRRGVDLETLQKATKIDTFFLSEMASLVKLELEAKQSTIDCVTIKQMVALKQAGFTDSWLAKTWNCSIQDVQEKQHEFNVFPIYEMIDAFSESNEDQAGYYYATWNAHKQSVTMKEKKEKVLMIGSGPIRIGQGVEFDYCSVQGIKSLQKYGYETILINNNPATVSTDYELADKLYFEPITAEDVLHVMKYEQIDQAIVQFGGQTAINLVKELEVAGVKLLGSNMDTIDTLEDRDRFYQYLQKIAVPHIPGLIATSEADLKAKSEKIGFPLLIRPSYVIGGKGMEIIESEKRLEKYIANNLNATSSYPILIDAYYPGKEVEVDVVTDGKNIFIPAIFEHIEKAGVHSGDSMAVTPPISLDKAVKKQIVDYAERVAKGIDFKGIFNIQFVIYNDTLYVLEVNPRASRTVPVISKVAGVNMIELATGTLLGKSLSSLCGNVKLLPENDFYTVKAPVFSTAKLPGVDPILVPEMKSTGELIAMSKTLSGSFKKAFLWNEQLKNAYEKKEKEIYIATNNTNFLQVQERLAQLGIKTKYVDDFGKNVAFERLEEWMKSDHAFAIYSAEATSDERERALEFNLIVMTAEETVRAFSMMTKEPLEVIAIQQLELAYEKEVVLQ
ncbi:carbamoyl phosphate synthase large subunit [Pseudogracilibacillus auburnensis]|uniref:Carbamoyl-phosphate synthase large subunit n=1 Tax=Pseudogracilibacillus auburnensis TaxID=1494959 RepID=A0A2V3WGT4_9BACI|nr:carbamoyl phosphate synthase large subunit [Pseudogracilibacillus auburnensis]PXW88019.1 carbamoyl-phosphate synthase large subunit [Pseudogracilibacillus auburnensis]